MTKIFQGMTTADMALWTIAGAAWIFGRRLSKEEYELAIRTSTPRERAEHQDMAASYNLASNVGCAYIAWKFFKVYPRATAAMAVGTLAIFALPGIIDHSRRMLQRKPAPQPLPAPASSATTAGPFGPYYAPNYYDW
jgi:hypothetical protein